MTKTERVSIGPSDPRSRPVVVVTIKLDIGGTERHLLHVLPRLRRRGVDVSLFVIERGGALEADMVRAGVPVLGLKLEQSRLPHLVAAWSALRRVCRSMRERPPIVHAFLPEAYFLAFGAVAFDPTRTLLMSRRSLAHYQRRRPVFGRLERVLHRRTTALLANSSEVAAELEEECGTPDKIALIHNGCEARGPIDPTARSKARAARGIADDELCLVVVANLLPYKGHADLLAALGEASAALGRWRLLVVGRDFGILDGLERRAAELGIAERIEWVGEVADPTAYRAAADIGLLVSHEEGFSNALLEMMSDGLPVIATDVGGNRDAIVHGESGLLVPAKAPDRLSAALVGLAADRELRERLGRAASARVAQSFSQEACVEKYERLYARIGTPNLPVRDLISRPLEPEASGDPAIRSRQESVVDALPSRHLTG